VRRLTGISLAVLPMLAVLLLWASPAFADNVVQGYVIHWLGTGDYIAVCPQGDTMQYHDVPGKYVAHGIPAQKVTCYLPSGNVDPTAPWEGQGVPVGHSGRLYPPQSAESQAPWIANLANLGVVTGIPNPINLVGDAINHWIATSLSNLEPVRKPDAVLPIYGTRSFQGCVVKGLPKGESHDGGCGQGLLDDLGGVVGAD